MKKSLFQPTFRFHLDTDRDGVPDFKDCRPFNPRLQHIKPNKLMREDFEKLPIYVEDKLGYSYHLLSKEAEQYAPRARTELLSAMKKNPWLISDIRKASKKRGYKFVYTPLHIHEQTPIRIREQLISEQPKVFEDYSIKSLQPFHKAYKERVTGPLLKKKQERKVVERWFDKNGDILDEKWLDILFGTKVKGTKGYWKFAGQLDLSGSWFWSNNRINYLVVATPYWSEEYTSVSLLGAETSISDVDDFPNPKSPIEYVAKMTPILKELEEDMYAVLENGMERR